MGLPPGQTYEMALWEFNACVRAYNRKQEAKNKADTVSDWRIAAFTGNAMAGKLKPLTHFIGDGKTVTAQKVTPEQQAEIDRKLAERRRKNGA